MKNIKQYIYLSVIIASLSVTAVSCASSQPYAYQQSYQQPYQETQVSVSGFYDALSPYGRWTSYGN
ncbi:hypothetical protein [Chitinophaga agri]|uniref:Uncharacterized protein n=1 Tax=Chitinophaga agri TaxID=2703787 RepID=A0A6B9ZH13_9BACT|nr:hypothetical protein [Chitinophaga agri]QHS60781.1 hypothetical protein GWR21_14610 [Chitinophaga agri]